jgi:hypothetical protein
MIMNIIIRRNINIQNIHMIKTHSIIEYEHLNLLEMYMTCTVLYMNKSIIMNIYNKPHKL